jgi:hypothetical protein
VFLAVAALGLFLAVAVIALSGLGAGVANLPDHPGAGNLDERTVRGADELHVGIGLAEVPHGTVIDDVRAAVRSEPDVRRPIEDPAPNSIREGLASNSRVLWA